MGVLIESDIARGALWEVGMSDAFEVRQLDAGIPVGIGTHGKVPQLCKNACPVDMKSVIA